MVDTNVSESPLEAAAGAAGPHATDAFGLLGNQTRLAIMLALWEAYDPRAEANAVAFSELRDRVGIRQGSQFNYHLDKLVGTFVRKTDDGYELRRSGRMLVQSIIAGIGFEEPAFEPTEIDAACKFCGAPTEISYENVYVYQSCTDCQGVTGIGGEHPDGSLVAWTFEPTGLADRSAEEVSAASTVKTFSRIALRFQGICPACSGPVEWSLEICEDHDPAADEACLDCGRRKAILAREICSVCKSSGAGPPGIKVLLHPAVVSFFYQRGMEVGFTGSTDFEDVVRTLELAESFDEEVVSADPARIRVTIAHDGDELHLLLDEEMSVVDVTERS